MTVGRALILLFFPLYAAAEEMPVEVTGCDGVLSSSQLGEAVRLELRGQEEQVTGYIRQVKPRARVRCVAGEIIVEVIADDGVALQESVRSVRLGLARFVAIAVAESVAARASAAANAPPKPAPPPPPPAPPRKRDLATWLWLGGAAMWGGTPGWWSGHGALGAELVLRSLVTLHVDLGVAVGSVAVDVGRVDAVQPSAALGVRLGKSIGWFRFEAGLAARIGAVVWSGHSEQPGVTSRHGTAPWLGPAADVVLSADVTRRLRVRLQLEVGVPALSASADGNGTHYARLDPVWVTAGLGLAVKVSRP